MHGQLRMVGVLGCLLIAAGFGGLGIWQQRLQQARSDETHATRLAAAQQEVESALTQDLLLRSNWLAGDPASVAYVADALAAERVDAASISDLFEERRVQLGLDAVGLIDSDGGWVTGTRPWQDSGGRPAGHAVFAAARAGRQAAHGLVREQERLFLGVIAPMLRGGVVVAYSYAGRRIDGAFLERLAALVPGELALVDDAVHARVWSSSGQRDQQAWLAALADASGSLARLPLMADSGGALLLGRSTRAPTIDLLPLWMLAAGFGLLWLLLLAICRRALLVPIDSALGLLERAAAGDRHLRAPAWPSGARGRFAAAFDVLMQRAGAR